MELPHRFVKMLHDFFPEVLILLLRASDNIATHRKPQTSKLSDLDIMKVCLLLCNACINHYKKSVFKKMNLISHREPSLQKFEVQKFEVQKFDILLCSSPTHTFTRNTIHNRRSWRLASLQPFKKIVIG